MTRLSGPRRLLYLLPALLLGACGGGDAPTGGQRPFTGPAAPGFPATLEGLSSLPAAAGRLAQADTGYQVDTGNRAEVLLFYKTVYASSSQVPLGWSGDIAGCNAGDSSAENRAAILRRINWFRAMAGVPAAVQFDATFNQKAQQAALMMAANQTLSHSPTSGWTCYTAAGAEGAGHSNLTYGRSGVESVGESYMRDTGSNNIVVGHRRWLLYPQTRFMGTGDVGGAHPVNALWVQDANLHGPRPAVRDDFVAWPPPGYTPAKVVYPRWSFSYPQANFSAATVTMTENGVPMAVRVEAPVDGYGENTVVWYPGAYGDGMDWAVPSADTTYQVTVSNVIVGGVARSFTYTAIVFDADSASADPATVTGSSTLATNQTGVYRVGAVPSATQYQWRSVALTPWSLSDGAEAGAGNFTVSTSAGYTFVTTDAAAHGSSSFHFAHPQAADQVMQLSQTLVPASNAMLQFASRLGLSSPMQRALVEVSVDGGDNWTAVFEQAGQQSGTTSDFGESTFTTRSISLAAFANRTVQLRWRYALQVGSWYPQTSAGVGWYVDDIQLTGVSAAQAGAANDVAGSAFQVTPAGSAFALQARPGMYGYYADWSPLTTVSLTAAATGPDCLFNFAQANFSQLFTPAASSQVFSTWHFRYYAATDTYLGVSSSDNNVYYKIGGGNPVSAGLLAEWLVTAGCPP